MKVYLIQIIAALNIITLTPCSYATDRKVTGLFSTFMLSERSGDIVGAEIHIVPNSNGYSAIVQGSEGAPGFPEVVTVFVKGNTITFDISASSASGPPPGKYNGRITSAELQLDGPTKSFKKYRMLRKNSYWQ